MDTGLFFRFWTWPSRLFTWLFSKRPQGEAKMNLLGLVRVFRPAAPTSEALRAPGPDAGLDLDKATLAIVKNILQLREKTVYEVMLARAEIIAMNVHIGARDLLAQIQETPHSRYPVYASSLDRTTGYVHIRDILGSIIRQGVPEKFDLQSLARDILFVAPTMLVTDLLIRMRREGRQIALVVDEFGGVDGLVTVEDLVEEIVGDITDEHETPADVLFEEEAPGRYLVDGRYMVEKLEARFSMQLVERGRDIDTLGGLVFFLADSVPLVGEVIVHPSLPLEFEVVKGDARRLRTLRLIFQDGASKPPEQKSLVS